MPGTIDSAVTRKSDDEVEREAKVEQRKADERREEQKRKGPSEQRPGEMPPDPLDEP